MRHACVTVLIGLALSIPGAVHAQTGSQAGGLREVALSVGLGNLSHGDDRLGWGGTLGGSVTIPIAARFAISVDAHRSYGPEPREQLCGIVNVVCTGVGHHGVRNLTIWSGNGIYYFSSAGVRPYVVGGLNVLHFTFISDVTTVRGAQATITESSGTTSRWASRLAEACGSPGTAALRGAGSEDPRRHDARRGQPDPATHVGLGRLPLVVPTPTETHRIREPVTDGMVGRPLRATRIARTRLTTDNGGSRNLTLVICISVYGNT